MLDSAGMHRWQPVAPSAHVDVQLDSPGLRWSGDGYWDSNSGDEPIEKSIRHWHWSRAKVQNDTAVIYDVTGRNGGEKTLATRFGRSGRVSEFEAPKHVQLPASGWRIARATRSEDGAASIIRTMEDTPFYARSVTSSRLFGETTTSMHESLDLDRFRSRIVQLMLPFRMPRRRR
jgi:carotenoid 1,2-hydratase